MSRRAGFREPYECNRIANSSNTDKWAVSRDWTVACHGGPLDGKLRSIGRGMQVPWSYRSATMKLNDPEYTEMKYEFTGTAPYQRVIFAEFVGTMKSKHGPERIYVSRKGPMGVTS